MNKQHVKGFLAAIAAILSFLGSEKVYQGYEMVKPLIQLSQQIATDQKTGQHFTVADVLEAMAQERVQQIVAQQRQSQLQPRK